jgi:FixJ family two-component response regulator
MNQMEACARPATGYTYARREPEKTALFEVIQQHLLTFEQQWTDKSDGRTRPNKTIAQQLGCAESTVEFHITALLKKARVARRSELIAKFWTAF